MLACLQTSSPIYDRNVLRLIFEFVDDDDPNSPLIKFAASTAAAQSTASASSSASVVSSAASASAADTKLQPNSGASTGAAASSSSASATATLTATERYLAACESHKAFAFVNGQRIYEVCDSSSFVVSRIVYGLDDRSC